MTYDLFNPAPLSNIGYSYPTSLPALKSNPTGKEIQRVMVLNAIKRGANNLLQISEMTGLAEKNCTGKIHLLIASGHIKYSEEKIKYKGFLRKKIELITV